MSDSQALRTNFVEAMSRTAFTVSIVATNGPAGQAGLTVSAMTSVSADPPSILVCVNRQSQFAGRIQQNASFSVSVLGALQSEIADVFAGRMDIEDRFSKGKWLADANSAPILKDAVVAFSCELIDCKPVGSHDVVIGLVQGIEIGPTDILPLIHHKRCYAVPNLASKLISSA